MNKKIFKVSNFDLNEDFLYFNFNLNQTVNNIGMFTDGELFKSDDGGGEETPSEFVIRFDRGFTTVQEACNEYKANDIWGGIKLITFSDGFSVGSQIYYLNVPIVLQLPLYNYYHLKDRGLNRMYAVKTTQFGLIQEIIEITNC